MAQTVYCPKCGFEMKLRTAQRGKFAGHQFYGCTRYPDCNGIVNIDVQNSQDSVIDNRPYIDTSSLNFPIRLTARSRSPGFKTVFLDTIAVPQRILNAANHYSSLHNVITNAAKWRLDFAPPDNYQPSNFVNAQISILEKIINRGRITRLSENLETEILNLSGNQLQYSVSSITHTYANYHTPNIPNQWTDGKKRAEFGNITAEEYFYKNILLKIIGESNIKDILPQVYFSSLVINRGTLQTASLSQRVDFLISHNGQAIVVEIDDLTHSNHQAKDMERDKILELNGLDSYRIPIDELNRGKVTILAA